jgi:RNase adaptor protein for sRNA GlmZ degradation
MHPPVKTTQHQIERMARSLEQTMARRRRLLKELRDLDQHIRAERKLLRDVIAEATASVDTEVIPGRPGGPRDDLASEFTSHDPKRRPPKPRRTRGGSRSRKG